VNGSGFFPLLACGSPQSQPRALRKAKIGVNVLVLQHAPLEGIGNMSARLAAWGATVRTARLFEDPTPPTAERLDLVVSMGGPMSANDEKLIPWLRQEKELLQRTIEAGVPVLGICLGAQLIAAALGARVYRNVGREIGWFPVDWMAAGSDQFQLPPSFLAFHWHGETFDLPPGAVQLARSAGCENQAFRIGRHVIGLQFHLEVTPDAVAGMVRHGFGDLAEGGPFVQSAQEILAPAPSAYAQIDRLMGRILEELAGCPSSG